MEKKSFFENAIFVGAKIKTKEGGEYRIMAIAEGYVMLRRKGCAPFIESKKDLIAWFEKCFPDNNHVSKEQAT